MIKLSTKSRYGVLACFQLALKNQLLCLSEISAISGISVKYLEQLFMKLKKAGLVMSERGTNGGYKLSKAPDEITLLDIMTALEGKIKMIECKGDDCKNSTTCPTKTIWDRVNIKVRDILHEITLQNLIDDYKSEEEK